MTVHLIDLFCGCGGFSQGGRQAGVNVLLAIDCWEDALKVHAKNHPNCTHVSMKLGEMAVPAFCDYIASAVKGRVQQGDIVHVHASPPCQFLSNANRSRCVETGLVLMTWSLAVIQELVQRQVVQSWTMEQVNLRPVKEFFAEHNYRVIKCSLFGCPTLRRRTFAGTIDWDAMQQRDVSEYHFRKVLVDNGVHVAPEQPIHAKSSLQKKSLDALSYTVTSRDPTLWNFETKQETMLPIAIKVALQTFPPKYFDQCGVSDTTLHKMVGNAIPPSVAQSMLATLLRGRA